MRNPAVRMVGIAILALGLTLTPGCERRGADDGTVRVVTTVGMIADMAKAIGGDCVSVTALMGPGVDPHVYRPSARDVVTLRDADLILYGGLLLEGKMADVLERIGRRVRTFAVLEQIERERLMPLPNLSGHYDPHLWMDVGLWADTVDGVAASLAEAVPDCADDMRARAQAYRTQLVALDAWARASLASIPEAQRAMVTAHDAFNYFGRAYGVEVRGIQGVSTEAEASVNAIRDTVSFIVARRIPAIFVESSINPRNIQAVRAAARHRGWEVGLGEQLFSDAMGEGGTWQGTYIGMIRHNVRSVVTALGGRIAPWPDELAAWSERFGLQES